VAASAASPPVVAASVAAAVVASAPEEPHAVREPAITAAIKSASICFFIIIISSLYICNIMHKNYIASNSLYIISQINQVELLPNLYFLVDFFP
jgi:hypothetical protein